MGKAPFNYQAEATQTKSDQFHGELVSFSYLQALLHGIASRIEELDKVKKALFYGKAFHEFPDPYTCQHLPASVGGDNPTQAIDVIHGIIGKITEAGEQAEALIKAMRGDGPLDMVNLLEEVGDGQWYDAIICEALGTSFEAIQQTNIAKLRARFPNKFTECDANNRDLDAERDILEHPYAVKLDDNGKGQVVAAGFAICDPDPRIITFTDSKGRVCKNKYFKDGTFEYWIDDMRVFALGPF